MSNLIIELKEKLDSRFATFERLKEEVEALQRVIAILESEERDSAQGTLPLKALPGRPSKSPKELTAIVKRMAEIINEHGGRIHRKDLFNTLRKEGISFSGRNPMGNFSAYLSKYKQTFKPIGDGYWALIDYHKPTV